VSPYSNFGEEMLGGVLPTGGRILGFPTGWPEASQLALEPGPGLYRKGENNPIGTQSPVSGPRIAGVGARSCRSYPLKAGEPCR
jgi:hypothetical protein